jgi:hypothetical protein
MQANTPWEVLPSLHRNAIGTSELDRFAAQYSARGLPRERFTSALAGRRASLGVGDGWLDLSHGGLSPPIL